MENNYREENEMLTQQLEEAHKVVEGLRKEIAYLKDKDKPSVLFLQEGATPMTVAEMVVRECNDKEWLNDVVYYINCYLSRN